MRVLLTGANGFIGSAFRRALRRAGHSVRPLVRTAENAEDLVGDLRHCDLQAAIAGCQFVVHAASRTAGSGADLWSENVETTQRVVDAAAAADAGVLYVSTTGVYGRAAGVFEAPDRMPRLPSSELSRARAVAEDVVLAAGGTVVRPHVVFGAGDRWVIPPLVEFMRQADAWLGGPDVRVAAVSVARLASTVAELVGRPLPPVLHAAEIEPVRIADLVRPRFAAARADLPVATVSVDRAVRMLRGRGVSRNALMMVGADSRMVLDPVWRDALTAPLVSAAQEAAPNRADQFV